MAVAKRRKVRAASGMAQSKAASSRSTSTGKAVKASTKRLAPGKGPGAARGKAPPPLEVKTGDGTRQARKATPAKAAPAKAAPSKAAPSKATTAPTRISAPPIRVDEGDPAPSFKLPDHEGNSVSSDDLAGLPYVLYFYPKDDTPGCTVQACGFRDASSEFEGAGVRVIGVSPDGATSHQRFSAKYNLPFTLLSDGEHQLATAYGTWALKKNYGREYMGIVRSTFLIGADGVIKKAWRGVRVNGHVALVQAAAEQLG